MVKKELRLVIDNAAKKSLQEAFLYISNDSLQNAETVKRKIAASLKELVSHPERHAPDKYRLNNDGAYRAYEIYKYRITYHISPDEIHVIQIRHTKTNPLKY